MTVAGPANVFTGNTGKSCKTTQCQCLVYIREKQSLKTNLYRVNSSENDPCEHNGGKCTQVLS